LFVFVFYAAHQSYWRRPPHIARGNHDCADLDCRRQSARSAEPSLEKQPGWELRGEAVDGRDAIQKSRELHPDLVILDFLMPCVNGLEAAHEINKADPRVPILLCSIFLSEQLMEQARKAGVRGAVSKTDVGEIVHGVEALLRRQPFFVRTQ
jgi:DNA-binding NarL/FixJ family response regulator